MLSLTSSDIFKTIQNDLAENDGKIFIQKGKYCAGHSKCEGIFYFNSKEQPIIKVATGGKTQEEWVGVLIHEYCHFLQWHENSKIWEEFDNQDFTFENVISNPKKFKKEILVLLKLELDCEKRAVKIIKNNKLFCTKEYAKFANAILYKYGYLYVNNIWPNSGAKYRAIADHCPNVLLKSHLNYIEIPNSISTLYSS